MPSAATCGPRPGRPGLRRRTGSDSGRRPRSPGSRAFWNPPGAARADPHEDLIAADIGPQHRRSAVADPLGDREGGRQAPRCRARSSRCACRRIPGCGSDRRSPCGGSAGAAARLGRGRLGRAGRTAPRQASVRRSDRSRRRRQARADRIEEVQRPASATSWGISRRASSAKLRDDARARRHAPASDFRAAASAARRPRAIAVSRPLPEA